MGQNARQRPARGAVDDLVGDRVEANGTPPERTFRAVPECRALPHVPEFTTSSWIEAVSYADRVTAFGYDCTVWADVVA